MNIAVIGCGYVGLVTGACLADLGHTVVAVDNDPRKVALLQAGRSPHYEPGLEEMVRTNAAEGRLRFSGHIAEAVAHGEIIFVAVNTPSQPNGEVDLSFVEAASRDIGVHMDGYRLIVEKSTVPVNTGDRVRETIQASARPGIPFDVASNPEFLREGMAVRDFLHPDRIVIGTSSDRAVALLAELYEPLNAPLLITDISSAELIKHAANAFLAMKISFINMVARLCERTGADVAKVAKGIGLDKRIGLDFLNAGVGFGGSCFPKDLAAFIHAAEAQGVDFTLLKEVQAVNRRQHAWIGERLREALGSLDGMTIAVLGLAFKPDTDDLRNATSLVVLPELQAAGARVRAHDPVAMEVAAPLLPGVVMCGDPYEAAAGADALVVITEWGQYKALDLRRMQHALGRPVIVDGRNLFDPARMTAAGFEYYGVGKGRGVRSPALTGAATIRRDGA